MTTDLQTVPPADAKLSQWVLREEVQAQITGAVGDVMNPETFIAHALVAFQDEKIRHCSPESKLKALFEMAALTLLPTLNQCVLLPYNVTIKDKDGRERKQLEIKLTPQWQGYKAVMERHPSVLEVQACLVHVLDSFLVENGVPEHILDPFDAKRLFRGAQDIRGGYCKVTYADGRPPRYHFSSLEYIQKCRRCAKTDVIWSAWYEKMARKTCYRDCYSSRITPVDPLVVSRMERIIAVDDALLGNDPVRIAEVASGNKRLRQALTKEPDDAGVHGKPQEGAEATAADPGSAAPDPEQAVGAKLQKATEDEQQGEQGSSTEAEDALALSDQWKNEYCETARRLTKPKDLAELKKQAEGDEVLNSKDRLGVGGVIAECEDKIRKQKASGGQKELAL